MAHYRKKPVVIEAFRFGFDEAPDWWIKARMGVAYRTGDDVFIVTLEGDMKVGVGDWVIKGVQDELYPCKNDIFLKTYEKVQPVGTRDGEVTGYIQPEKAIVVDWDRETDDPVGFLDSVYEQYQKTMGKPTPDAESAKIVEKCRMMVFDLWCSRHEEIRRMMAEYEQEK